jgi:hypothetical protein
MKKLPPDLEGQRFETKESTKNGVTSTVFDVAIGGDEFTQGVGGY